VVKKDYPIIYGQYRDFFNTYDKNVAVQEFC